MFDLLFPPSFIFAEVARIYGIAGGPAWDHVRELMLQYYVTLADDRSRCGPAFAAAGDELFLDADRARALVRADWPRWVAENLALFERVAPVTPSARGGAGRAAS